MFKIQISDIKFLKILSAEDILIRSSNVGTLMIARKIEEKFKQFINETNLLKSPIYN